MLNFSGSQNEMVKDDVEMSNVNDDTNCASESQGGGRGMIQNLRAAVHQKQTAW